MERVTLENSETVMSVHSRKDCHGYWCTIHYPSPHHMRNLPQVWDSEGRSMFRICLHGVMHPDPDDPSSLSTQCYVYRSRKTTCDGCCKRPFDLESEIS